MFDLEGFRAYNDSFGHPEGDLLLRRLCRKLAEALGASGTAYRLGADEFCALIRAEERDVAAIEAVCWASLSENGEGFRIRTSAGRVTLRAEAQDPTSALTLADQRMYTEKDSRRSSAKQQTRDVVLRVLAKQDPDLRDHVSAVAELARPVGSRLGLEGSELEDMVRAAELHDVGKIAIPDPIIYKPGPLDDEEWRFMCRHTLIGGNILSAAPALAGSAKAVRSSHERIDGSGYPDGLWDEEIPLASRIVFVCDSLHAMTSDRPYKPAMRKAQALAELQRCAGTQFDRTVVGAFCGVAGLDVQAGGSKVAAMR